MKAKINSEQKFIRGDVVKKLNGQTKMTVNGYGYSGSHGLAILMYPKDVMVECVWFNSNNKLYRKSFHQDKLILNHES